MRRRRRYDRSNSNLPKIEPLTGPVIGAKLLGVPVREEGVIAQGASSERWRLTDDIDALLLDDYEFISGGSLREVKEALELRHPSPVPGASMIEVCNSNELKRHNIPFGHPAIMSVRKNPEYERQRWGDKYITTWLPDTIGTLEQLCMGGNDVLVSTEVAEQIREDDDFDTSDLVIGKRDTWYSIVKYKPGKAAARRKTRNTITAKDKHTADLVAAGRELRVYASAAYVALRDELNEFGVNLVITQTTKMYHSANYHNTYDDPETRDIVREVQALVRIHGALRGKHAFRYNEGWQNFLEAIRKRPKDIKDDSWGNYADVKIWLEAECKVKKPKPTKKMIAAAEAARVAAIKARTCAGCDVVADEMTDLYKPPVYGNTKFAPGTRFCSECWEARFNVTTDEVEQPSLAAAT